METNQTNAHSNSAQTPWQSKLLWLLLISVLSVVSGAFVWQSSRPKDTPENKEALPEISQLADFKLSERNGESIGLETLKGKINVVNFFFTSCSVICVEMTNSMKEIQDDFPNAIKHGDLQLVSITVDPERDTVEKLREYADRAGADKTRWLFLTGEQSEIYQLAQSSFKLGVAVNDPESIAQGQDAVMHSSKLVLVDGKGIVRAYFDGRDEKKVNELKKAIRRLLQENSP